MRLCPILCAIALGATVLASCAAQPSRAEDRSSPGATTSSPKAIVVGVKTPPPFLYRQLNPTNTNAGGGPELADLVSSGLSAVDDHGLRIPQLAETVPSIDNGLWTLAADGTMELTWRIKPNARWHDGAALTADDLAFTLTVGRDKNVPTLHNRLLDGLSGVQVVDDHTLVTDWGAPYIDADSVFSGVFAIPLPVHLLGDSYQSDPTGLTDQPYFSSQFIGTGPFKVRSFDPSDGITLDAFSDYVLGRPKVDTIEVRFITDDNALIAGLLSGSIDTILGPVFSLEQALQVRDQWSGGKEEHRALSSWLVAYPQFVDPGVDVILNPQFRRALMDGVNRQEMTDSIQFGAVPIGDSPISPNSPYYESIQSGIVRYPYDPSQAVQMIQDLGYRREGDGLFADAAGNKLTVNIQVTRAQEIQVKTALAIADYWRQVGVSTDMDVVPVQLAQDRQYRANFPGFSVQRQPTDVDALPKLHSSEARLASRGFSGTNNARYMNPVMDALIEQYGATVPLPARTQIVGQIVHRITDEVIWMGMFFDTEPSLISNRLVNVGPKADGSIMTWNASEWTVK